MARLSSIFSFDTLERAPRLTRAGGLALLICVLARAALLLKPDALRAVPESELQQLYTFNELRYRTGEQPHPKVLVMGTSRLGILPAQRIAAAAGCAEGDVANYSLAGNTFWRTLAFFRRNPDILRDAKVVIFDLLPFQLYEGSLNTGDDEVLLRLATWKERLMLPGWDRRALAVADYAFPAWSERHSVAGWQIGLRMARLDAERRATAFTQAAAAAQRYQAVLAKGAANKEGAQALQQYVPEPKVSPLELAALHELGTLLPRGCVLLYAWLPVRGDFAAAVQQDSAEKQSYEIFRDAVERAKGPGVALVWADNTRLNMNNTDFTDLVHYTTNGIEKVCGALEGPLKAGAHENADS